VRCLTAKFLIVLKGDIYVHESLVAAIKSADVVISAVGSAQLPDQTRIIAAIKEAGNVKVSSKRSKPSVENYYA
jgi:putative NADH-flavin reductase